MKIDREKGRAFKTGETYQRETTRCLRDTIRITDAVMLTQFEMANLQESSICLYSLWRMID